MADEKKPSVLPTPITRDPFVELVGFLVSVMFVVYLVNGFFGWINSNNIFSGGWENFTTGRILLTHTIPVYELGNPIGSRIITVNDIEIFDAPAGRIIGKQKEKSEGKIIEGPATINFIKYWLVDFDQGIDGWVKESEIAILVSEPSFIERTLVWVLGLVWFVKLILISFSIFCFVLVIYLYRKTSFLRQEERKLLYPEINQSSIAKNPAWERILFHLESLNENDWRLSILEADIMLGGILDNMFLPGEGIGEKLKAVEKSDFTTIDNAWEAHKIRNQIAHEGAAFVMNQHEAKRVIELYRSVFDEFQII